MWLQGWVFAKHDIILLKDRGTIIIGNVRWKWREQDWIVCLDESFTENTSLHLLYILYFIPLFLL